MFSLCNLAIFLILICYIACYHNYLFTISWVYTDSLFKRYYLKIMPSPFTALKNELLRLDREQHHLEYLTTCKELGLIPKFLQSKSTYISDNFPNYKYDFERRCLSAVIRRKHALVDRITKVIYGYRNSGLYYKLAHYASGGVYDHSLRVIAKYRDAQLVILEKRLQKKIQNLSGNLKLYNQSEVKSDFLNLSSRCFTEREITLLNKGPKYILDTHVKPIDFVPQLEDLVKNVPPDKRDEVRCSLFVSYKKHMKRSHITHPHEKRLINGLKSDPDIAIVKTDKSNKIAILDRADFIAKMDAAISSIDCELVNVDPLPSTVYKVGKIAKEFKNSCWPEHVRKLSKLNPLGVIPHLIGVLKDHKPLMPIRPIVRKCMAPSYFIEKVLVLVLKECLPPSPFVISSTAEFITKLEMLNLPDNFSMFSMDIIALYPSVDMVKARDNILNCVNTLPSYSDNMKTTIVSALNFLIANNYFIFHHKIYRQKSGAPMGSPVSGLIAEFILRPLEEAFFESITLHPLCWMRYVDDIFGIWTHSSADFETFFNALNTQDSNIQFTKEVEENGSITFLDVYLERDGSVINRSVYRKKCNSLSTIPRQASAPLNYKQSAFGSYIKRALTICTPNNIHNEFNNIRRIAINNGFSVKFIDNLILKCNRQFQHPPNDTINPIHCRVSISYIPGLFEKIKRMIKPYGIQVIARTGSKLRDILSSNMDTIDKLHMAGVYEIPLLHLDNSVTFYIGQTARKLINRVNEHKADFRKGSRNSAIFRAYARDPSIQVLFNEARILAPYSTSFRTVLRESIEIYNRASEVCNEQDSCKIPGLWLSIVNQ